MSILANTRSPDFSPLKVTLDSLQTWTEENKVSINHTKIVVMHFCISSGVVPAPQLSVDSHSLQVFQLTRLFGITVDDQLNRKQHVSKIMRAVSYIIYMLRKFRSLGTLIFPRILNYLCKIKSAGECSIVSSVILSRQVSRQRRTTDAQPNKN